MKREIRNPKSHRSTEVNARRTQKVIETYQGNQSAEETCNICCRSASNPFRVYDEHGKVTEGCVSAFHTGHLIPISESNRWHNRPQAKQIRRNLAAIKFNRCRAPYL